MLKGEIIRPVTILPEEASISEVLHQLIRESSLDEVEMILRMIREEMDAE